MRVNLYVIVDSQSGLMVTNILPSTNDVTALLGFTHYVKDEKERTGVDPRCFRLKRLGQQEENGNLVNIESHFICRGDQAESQYSELLSRAIEAEEGI